MLKKFGIILLAVTMLMTACNQSAGNSNLQSEKPENTVVETEDKVIDEAVKADLLKTIQEYQYMGMGKNFSNPYDGDYTNFLLYSFLKAEDLKNLEDYYKENISNSKYSQIDGYVFPKSMVAEILDISFGICEFNYYLPDYNYDDDNYFFSAGGMGYMMEHKIRTAKALSDGSYKVVVDEYYPDFEDETPTYTKEYIIKPYILEFQPKFWGEFFKKGDTVYKILSVSDFCEGNLKPDAVEFDNPFEVETLTYKTNKFIGAKYAKSYYLPKTVKSGNGFSFLDIFDELGIPIDGNNLNYWINFSPDLSEIMLSISQNDSLKEHEYMQESLERDIKSICETFKRNISALKTITVMIDGEKPYKPNDNKEVELEIDKNGVYSFDNIVLPTTTKEELKKIADSIPYKVEKPDSESMRTLGLYFDYADDEEKVEIADFLQNVFGTSYCPVTFENSEQIPQKFLTFVGFNVAPYYEWGNIYDDANKPQNYYIELEPFSETCFDNMGILKINVEKAVKEIFGNDIIFKPERKFCDPWDYDEYSQMFTPPHMGIGSVVPAILDIREKNDGYVVTTAFLGSLYDSLCYDRQELEPETAIDYLKENAIKYEINLKKGGEFGFIIKSVKKIYS